MRKGREIERNRVSEKEKGEREKIIKVIGRIS